MYGWQLESLQKSKECCQGVPKQKIKERWKDATPYEGWYNHVLDWVWNIDRITWDAISRQCFLFSSQPSFCNSFLGSFFFTWQIVECFVCFCNFSNMSRVAFFTPFSLNLILLVFFRTNFKGWRRKKRVAFSMPKIWRWIRLEGIFSQVSWRSPLSPIKKGCIKNLAYRFNQKDRVWWRFLLSSFQSFKKDLKRPDVP